AIPTGESAGICGVRRSRSGRGAGVGSFHETSSQFAGAFSAIPTKNRMVPASGRRLDGWNGGMAVRLMVLLLILKLLAVTTSYASGNAGGIFGPSLFIGAMLGGIVGNV